MPSQELGGRFYADGYSIISPKGVIHMKERGGFSADINGVRIREREKRFSDKFSDEDIERALRRASMKVGEFVMPEERRQDYGVFRCVQPSCER